jgi:integrase
MTDLTVPGRPSGVTDTPDTPTSRPDEPADGRGARAPGPAKRPHGTGTLRSRGPDRWQLRVRLRNDDGTPGRQVTKTVGGTREEAERALARFVVSAQVDEERRRQQGTPLGAIVEDYLARCETQELAPITIYGYRREWAKVADDLGGWFPDETRTRKASAYFDTRHCDGMPASTVNAILRVLRAACSWGIGQDEIHRNPFSGVELLPTAKAPTVAPTDAQVAAVLAQAEVDDMLVAVAIRLAAVTGSRRGELPVQRWSDVDFDGRRVRRHSATSAPPRERDSGGKPIGIAEVVVRQTKTGADTWHPVDDTTMDLLRSYRAQCEDRAADHGVTLDADAFILSNEPDGSRPVRPDAITKRVRAVAERVPGAEGVRPKHLRKWAATILATEMAAAVAQARLDHADPQTTLKHYVARNEAAEREAADRLGDHLDEGSDAA